MQQYNVPRQNQDIKPDMNAAVAFVRYVGTDVFALVSVALVGYFASTDGFTIAKGASRALDTYNAAVAFAEAPVNASMVNGTYVIYPNSGLGYNATTQWDSIDTYAKQCEYYDGFHYLLNEPKVFIWNFVLFLAAIGGISILLRLINQAVAYCANILSLDEARSAVNFVELCAGDAFSTHITRNYQRTVNDTQHASDDAVSENGDVREPIRRVLNGFYLDKTENIGDGQERMIKQQTLAYQLVSGFSKFDTWIEPARGLIYTAANCYLSAAVLLAAYLGMQMHNTFFDLYKDFRQTLIDGKNCQSDLQMENCEYTAAGQALFAAWHKTMKTYREDDSYVPYAMAGIPIVFLLIAFASDILAYCKSLYATRNAANTQQKSFLQIAREALNRQLARAQGGRSNVSNDSSENASLLRASLLDTTDTTDGANVGQGLNTSGGLNNSSTLFDQSRDSTNSTVNHDLNATNDDVESGDNSGLSASEISARLQPSP